MKKIVKPYPMTGRLIVTQGYVEKYDHSENIFTCVNM